MQRRPRRSPVRGYLAFVPLLLLIGIASATCAAGGSGGNGDTEAPIASVEARSAGTRNAETRNAETRNVEARNAEARNAEAPDAETRNDSVLEIAPGEGRLTPIDRIVHPRIDECSGIIWTGDAFVVHNDSGDQPVLYRSATLDFAEAEVLTVPGAQAVDWEDITILDGDILIGDIGDNARKRPHLTLYRVRYHPAAAGDSIGRLERIAEYRFRYPDGPHDAEALAVVDGTVTIISKARSEKVTHVYAFDTLTDAAHLGSGEFNVPRLAGALDLEPGEQITGADYDPQSGTLVLLTYTQILRYPGDRIEGAPAARTLIAARQCEAICFQGARLVFANEQRDVYAIDHFVQSDFASLLPARGAALLHMRPAGDLSFQAAQDVFLTNARASERFQWLATPDSLRIAARFLVAADPQPTRDPDAPASENAEGLGIGSAVLFSFTARPSLALTGEELQLIAGLDAAGDLRVWRLRLAAEPPALERFGDGRIRGALRDGALELELALPFPEILGDTIPNRFLFDVRGLRLRGEQAEEVRFSGEDDATAFRPYTWGDVTIDYAGVSP